MAEHTAPTNAPTEAPIKDLEDHLRSYRGFLKGVIVMILASAFTLVSLCAFAFGHTLSLLLGWVILVVGFIVLLVDLRSGTTTWRLSLITLLIFGLITAANVA
jgi:hypothetical protein